METLLGVACDCGLDPSGVEVLSDRSTTVVDLVGTGVVARIRKPIEGESYGAGLAQMQRERRVALGLFEAGGPVIRPVAELDVMAVGSTWVSFWHREMFTEASCDGNQLAESVVDIEDAFGRASVELEPLSTWKLASNSAVNASQEADSRLRQIGDMFFTLDDQLLTEELVAAHGDAHPGNLLHSDHGWLWVDLEDVSLMPRYWDIATAVARSVLLGWHPDVSVGALRRYCELRNSAIDHRSFVLALKARCVQITLLCWDWADGLQESAQQVDTRIEGTLALLHDPDGVLSWLLP